LHPDVLKLGLAGLLTDVSSGFDGGRNRYYALPEHP
jgi:hypothetical protein